MEVFHSCSHSFLLASSKPDPRKEICEENKAEIKTNLFINLFTTTVQLITQTRSPLHPLPVSGRYLRTLVALGIPLLPVPGKIHAQVPANPPAVSTAETGGHSDKSSAFNLSLSVHQPPVFLRDQSPRLQPALQNALKRA